MDVTRSRLSVFVLLLAGTTLLSCHRPTPEASSSIATPSPNATLTQTLKLESPAFKNGEMIPQKYTCDGEDVSPPLRWSGVPENAKELVLIVDDPDAPGKTWVHWVVYDIPPSETSLIENVTRKVELAHQPKQGANDFKRPGYGGPCPPSGTHRYYFKIYALDVTTSFAKVFPNKDDMLQAISGHVLAQGELMGTYKR